MCGVRNSVQYGNHRLPDTQSTNCSTGVPHETLTQGEPVLLGKSRITLLDYTPDGLSVCVKGLVLLHASF